jgi:type IV pilus assembly protein PilE
MRHARGFTLVELLIAVTVATLIAGIALPSYQSHVHKSRRADAIAALMKLEFAQAGFQANNGIYTDNLAALRQPATSDEGHYAITVTAAHAGGYTASAQALAHSPQHADEGCATLTLTVQGERVARGPSRSCWNR